MKWKEGRVTEGTRRHPGTTDGVEEANKLFAQQAKNNKRACCLFIYLVYFLGGVIYTVCLPRSGHSATDLAFQ